jgi:hypothetical protein
MSIGATTPEATCAARVGLAAQIAGRRRRRWGSTGSPAGAELLPSAQRGAGKHRGAADPCRDPGSEPRGPEDEETR